VHVLDASRAVPVVSSLISKEQRATFAAHIVRSKSALVPAMQGMRRSSFPLEQARANRTPIQWRPEEIAHPERIAVRILSSDDADARRAEAVSLEEIARYIDWSPFFHTWDCADAIRQFSTTKDTVNRRASFSSMRRICSRRSLRGSFSPRALFTEFFRRTRWVMMWKSTAMTREPVF
jgi:5-methyltetrahydrofolate--homocysteine methyltransferase